MAAIGRIQYTTGTYRNIVFTLSNITNNLYAYDANDGSNLWTSNATFASSDGAAVQLVDLDGDGWIEILCGNKIYAAESGKLLCSIGTNLGLIHGWATNNRLIQTVTGDVLDNGKQQVCIGNAVYSVSITDRTGTAGNIMTLEKSITPTIYNGSGYETLGTTDGATQLADFDLDGNLDVLVSTVINRASKNSNSALCIYIWSPAKNKIIASKKIGRVYKRSVPFIGDIDGDGYPEAVIIRGGASGNDADAGFDKITALKYNPASATGEMTVFWDINHDDISGATGITLFDFNQDGISELVYRDNQYLRIINGSKKDHLTGNPSGVYDLATIGCGSATCYEYPVVADIDNDGQAEIITTGSFTQTSDAIMGSLRIFKAGTGTKWAPARKVWNQYSYNAVNVNEDLTIPAVQFNPATVLPGEDGLLGTSDDVRPYNNFLQQQTTLNANGLPVWLTPNAIVLPPQFEYDVAKDSATIHVAVANVGNAAFSAPFYVTAYKNNAQGTPKYTYAYPNMILAGDTAHITFGISDFKANGWVPFDHILIRTNDDGNGYTNQSVCDSAFIAFETSSVIAVDDHVTVLTNSSDNQIFVTINDLKPCSDPTVDTITGGGAKHGTVEIVNDSVIVYTPDTDYLGVDSVIYRIYCNPIGDVDTAVMYILVQKPLSQEYVACQGAWEAMGFETINGVSYWWYDAETGGNPVKSTASDTIQRQKDNTSKQTWWAEARYGAAVFPRYRVDLLMGDCGVTDPQNCAKDGTVLFREDFGGNEISDQTPSNDSLPSGTTTYYYTKLTPGDGYYTLTKYFPHPDHERWHAFQDHTVPGTDRGYYMLVNADYFPGLFYTATISGLCQNSKLYFSAWVGNMMKSSFNGGNSLRPQLRFVLQDATTNVTLATFVTTEIPPENQPTWKMYGFEFVTNSSAIKLSIYNDAPGGEGNDLTLDDIEIRICTPPVTTNIVNNDTTVCYGADLNIIGTYTEDCTFGDALSYRWEFRHKDSVNWKPVAGNFGDVSVDCDSPNVTDREIEDTVKITAATKANEGYYRMLVSSAGSIDAINCRAASDSVYVHVVDRFVAPDIRLQVCSSPLTIQLSSYLDSTDYNRIEWSQVSSYPVITNLETGLIQDAIFQKGTYTYKYTLSSPEYLGCGSISAKAYVRALNDHIFGKTADTITICSALDLSRFVNLNQIFGLELGGVLEYGTSINPDNTVSNNVKVYALSSKYAGAHVFNAQKAYSEAGSSYDYIYQGATVKKFEFVYTASCISGSKRVVIIVTN